MLEKRQLRLVVVGLILINVLTIVFFLSRPDWKAGRETVAKVGNETITRQEWLNELETSFGEDTLRGMVDEKVIKQMAKQYEIDISKSAIDQELTMYKVLFGPQGQSLPGQEWEEQVKLSLILEELLTKDAIISEDSLMTYYQENIDFYDFPTTYHLSQIVVKTEQEAKQTINELKDGSSFPALALERSLDEFSVNRGGDIGYINEDDSNVEQSIIKAAQEMKQKSWSAPVKLESGYAVLYLHEKLEGKKYSFEEVKAQIRRQIAIEQMETAVSAQAFWNEADVSWFYENKD